MGRILFGNRLTQGLGFDEAYGRAVAHDLASPSAELGVTTWNSDRVTQGAASSIGLTRASPPSRITSEAQQLIFTQILHKTQNMRSPSPL
jgi:hypothetical protein